MKKSYTAVVSLALAGVALGACSKQATGQVVAVVNDEEVTLSELNSELKSLGSAAGNKDQIRRAALQNVIDRKLLAQQARERGIDKTPDFILQERRNEEQLLVSLLGRELTKNVTVPAASDVEQYLTNNPQSGAGRIVYRLDQITFDQPADASALRGFEADKSLDDVARRLTRLKIQFTRQAAGLDTAIAPPALAQQFAKLPAGEPLMVNANGRMIVSVVTGKQSTPLAPDAARALATQAIQRQAVDEIAKRQVAAARASAKIQYQPAFDPGAKTPSKP